MQFSLIHRAVEWSIRFISNGKQACSEEAFWAALQITPPGRFKQNTEAIKDSESVCCHFLPNSFALVIRCQKDVFFSQLSLLS